MPTDPWLVLFCGGMGGTPAEEMLAGALRECALDTLEDALSTGAYGGAIVVADRPSADYLGPLLPAGVRLDVDQPGEEFHLGRRLAEVVTRYHLERPVYVGSGLPLVRADELAAVASTLAISDFTVVSNNYFSADLVGFVPGGVVEDIELPNNDRILPRLLVQEANLVNQSLPRTVANQFDIDTPCDLAIVACAGGAGPRLSSYLSRADLDTSTLEKASSFFTDSDAEVLVAGRLGSQVWQYLESETACRVRVYSEERGMQAAGRDASGEARTLLGYHLRAVGPQRFFRELSEMAQAAFIDTRPLFTHMGLQPSRPDRFRSDALEPDGIVDPWLREFTLAAREAPVPVVLGGSSLVTSGIQLLSEAAWRRHDRQESAYKAMGRARRTS